MRLYNRIRKKLQELSGLALSIIISLSIVLFIHFVFIVPNTKKVVDQGKTKLYSLVENSMSQYTEITDNDIKNIIDLYKAKEDADISIERIQSKPFYKFNSQVININKQKYMVTISDAFFIREINLALFGSVLLLFSLTFFFIRIIFLYRENTNIRSSLSSWQRKMITITGKIKNIQPSIMDALNEIQNGKPSSFKEWEQLYYQSCELDVLLDLFKHDIALLDRFDKIKANLDYKFTNYYLKHFQIWQKEAHPLFIHNIMDDIKNRNFKQPVFLMVFDSMRFDHWLAIKPFISKILNNHTLEENIAWSLLPTYTTYCRNSLLAGKNPRECADLAYHGHMVNNQYESVLFHKYLQSHNLSGQYIHLAESQDSINKIVSMSTLPDITALVYMFVDGLTHSMSHVKSNESLFREHVLVEFSNIMFSGVLDLIKKHNITVVITSDHGNILTKETIRVNQFDILGHDRKENISQVPERFLVGKVRVDDLRDFKTRNTHLIMDPEAFLLPGTPNTNYAICRGPFKYQTDDRRQIYEYAHGGASISELLVPYIILKPEL